MAKTTRDSDEIITCNTKVVNYKNDAATRRFFVEQIGHKFHFTDYLRQFAKKRNNGATRVTYGDLVKGWLAEKMLKNTPGYKGVIGRQFKYNKFIRDYFFHEKDKNIIDAAKAWKKVRNIKGGATYHYYKRNLKNL